MYNSGDGSSKSVELHLDNHVSHVTLHAAAHATVADLVSTAISASSSTVAASAAASALTPRVLARQYDCTDTSGNRITLDTLASAAPASLVVTESGNSGTAVGGGSGGSASSAAVSAVAAPVGGRSRGRGRGRGRSRGGVASSGPTGGSGHRRGGTAAAKARTSKGEVEGGADEENDEDGQEGEEEEEEEEVVTGVGSSGSDREGENDSSAAFTVSDDDSEDASSNEGGSSENADADDYSGNAEEEEDAKAEGESDGETSSATASTIATTRLRRGGRRRSAAAASTTTAATGAGRGRGRGRGRGGSRGSTRGSSTSTTSLASTATTAAASPAVTAEPKPTRRSSRTPLLFTPDGIPIKRKRGRPPKSQQIAFAAAVAAAAAAAASGGGGAPLTADKTARKTRRSAKTEAVLVAEEVKPRRGGRRRRRSDVEAETPAAANNAPASTAATAMTDGAPAVSITGLDDASVSAVSARGRRGAAAAVAVMGEAVTMKRSRSPSSSPHATPTTAAAPSSVGGDAEDRTWKTARAGPGAVTMSTTRARNVAALEQQQQRLQRLPEEEQQEQVPHAQRRPVRLTYNVYYPAAAITPVPASTEARDEKAKTGGSSSSGALASTAAASSASCFLNSDSTPARPRYAWNSLPVALADHPHLQSSLFELLRSVSSYVAAAAAASATAAASASAETTAELVPAIKAALSETGDAAQLCRQAQLTVAAWRAGFHRTPSLLLSHPYGPWVLPGMRVYRSPAATLECWRRLKANSGGSSLKGEGSSVKQEVDDGNDDAGPASVNAAGSNHAAKSGERHRLSPSSSSPPFDWCYPNQSLIIPLVVGGCVQLVNPESKDKSHQWTVYVRGLWNGHPEEVANPNPLSPSSPSLAQHDGLPTGVSAGLLSESQTSTLSTSAAAPNDYLSDFIEKVVFVLDESFVPCVRVVHSAPFELTEVGWGEFIVSIHVHLKVPGQTVQARHVQDQLLQYYCGFNGRTIMQTTDGRGTKPHDPVSTFITGGVRGPNNLWTALATPLPTTSGTIPPTPARPLSELRHQLQYDSLLDINSNSGARMMYYRSPYLPLHLVTCDSTSASESSSSSSNSDSNSNKDESDGEADGDAENNGRGFSNAVDASSQDDGNATRCVAGGERGGGGGASVGSNGGEGLIGGGMSQADSENEESRRASPAHQVVTTATSSTSPFPAKPATPTNVSTSSSCSGCKTPSVASLDWTGGGGGGCASAAAITTGTGSSSDSGTVDHVARAADGGVGVGGGEEVRVVASEMNHRAGYAGRGHRSNTAATTSSDSSHASRSPRRGPGRRPHRFGVSARAAATSKATASASAAGSGGRGSTPGSPTGAGGVAAGGAAGAKKPFAEVHVGHGGNVVVLQHLLRFSHRPRYPAAIPPARDPRTQGPRPELLGYTMVAEPVVTEQYDELVLPLEAFGDVTALQEKEAVAANTGASCTTAAGGRTTSAAAACANLRRVVEAASKLEGHLRATLRRQLSLDLNTPSSAVSAEQQPSASMPPLTNVEAQTLGHPGGISSWPQVLDYGNGIERDTAYTAAFLSSAARSAEEEGWLALSLQDTRRELFGVAAAAASPRCMYACATPMSASEEVQEHGKAENVTRHAARFSPRVKAEGNDGGAAVQRGDEAGWVTAFEYDLASVLMRLPSVTAHDVFFDLLLPRAEEIGTAVWADLCRGIATLCITPPLPQPSAGSSTVSAAGAAATAVKNEPVWATSALQESEDEEGKAIDKNSTEACVWQNTVTSALRSSPVHLSHAYPLCSLRSTDTGIAVLRSLALVSTASGSAHGTSSPPVQAAPSSSTSNTSAISATSVNSLFASSLGSTNVASQAGLLNTGGTVAPPTVATATTHHPSHASGGSGSSSGYAHQESLMASMLRDGQTRGSFGHDGDVKQLLSWRAALETSIAAMRVEVARRQAAAVLEEL